MARRASMAARMAALPKTKCSCGHVAVAAGDYYTTGPQSKRPGGTLCVDCFRKRERERQRQYRQGATPAPTLKTANHPKAQRVETDIERVAVRAKGRARRKGLRGHVYLVQEKGNKRAVKVGHTFQSPPQARLNGLQTGNPRLLIMLAAKSGTEADEAALHSKYIAHNILGEWFKPTPKLLAEFGLKPADMVS